MNYPSKIKALEQKSSYFGKWQNEVAERLQGKKTDSMGKYATKAMEIRREEKHRRSSLSEHGLESRLNEFQFTSVTNASY